MLLELNIRNFSIIQELSLSFGEGMTIFTGETGAGKSILIDALALCLGERADASMIRQGMERTEISAIFSLEELPIAIEWLELNQFSDGNECFLRRVITKDGRSRSFINGRPASLSQMKELGIHLIQIYGQNTHQALLRLETQRDLLDQYAQSQPLLAKLKLKIHEWRNARRALDEHLVKKQQHQVRLEWLNYQLEELKIFAPQAEEYLLIELEHKRLNNSNKILELASQASFLLSGDAEINVLSLLHQTKRKLEELITLDTNLSTFYSQFEEVLLQLSALSEELDYYGQNVDLDAGQLSHIEERLAGYLSLARKHHIKPEELYELYQNLCDEYENIKSDATTESQLSHQVEKTYQESLSLAAQLHDYRTLHSTQLSQKMTELMKELAMPHGHFEILVEASPETLNEVGYDRIEFQVTTNPGQPSGALSKVVSGGELSRLALALQVITTQKRGITGMIFDEIDAGVSGSTASRVGELLKQLSKITQVMCVTHLPQVAGYGNNHFFVQKVIIDNETLATITPLDKNGRLYELARLLSGGKITKNSLANAQELLVI